MADLLTEKNSSPPNKNSPNKNRRNEGSSPEKTRNKQELCRQCLADYTCNNSEAIKEMLTPKGSK